MNRLIAGLILLAIGLWGATTWWWFIWDVLKGLIVIVFFLAGLIMVGSGVKSVTQSTPEPAKNSSDKKN